MFLRRKPLIFEGLFKLIQMKDFIPAIDGYFSRLRDALALVDRPALSEIMNVLEAARLEGRGVFVMGNGGSAATASHFVCDFNKGISMGKERRYRLHCLNDNVPSLMAIANDLSYDNVFVEQLRNFYREGDVVLGISGSGNSENVVRALRWAAENGAVTIGFTGYDGGAVRRICRYNLHIPLNDMQIVEDLHLVANHCMMKILCGE